MSICRLEKRPKPHKSDKYIETPAIAGVSFFLNRSSFDPIIKITLENNGDRVYEIST